jgi:hypothetical protein
MRTRGIIIVAGCTLALTAACGSDTAVFGTGSGGGDTGGQAQGAGTTVAQGGNTSQGGSTSQGGNTSQGGTTSQGGNGGSTSQGGSGGAGHPDGEPCANNGECSSGNCVDDVCCDTLCDGECESCALTGSVGTCTLADAGTDPDMECGAGSCDGTNNCATGDALWAIRGGNASQQYTLGVATDTAGNVIITGYYFGSLDWGGGAMVSAGSADVFVAKFDPNGTEIWHKSFGDTSGDFGYDVAVDSGNNIIVTGFFNGGINFGTTQLTSGGTEDAFLVKLNSAGDEVWAKRFGDGSAQMARAVAVGPSDVIAVGGYFFGAMDLGGGTLTGAGGWDAFAGMFDASGTHIWSDNWGDNTNQQLFEVAVDSTGSTIVSGQFVGSIDFGGGTHTSSGSTDIFIAKFSVTGVYQWSDRFGNGQPQIGRSVAVDASNNVILAGHMDGTANFGTGVESSSNGSDIFIVKFDANGQALWSDTYPGTNDQELRDVTVDSAGNILTTGWSGGETNFGGGLLAYGSNGDAFVAKHNGDGVHLWSYHYGIQDFQSGYSITVDGSDNVLVGGFFDDAMTFGMTTLTSAGSADAFLAKLAP